MTGWGSTYTGQNLFPEFEERDKFIVPKVIEGYSSSGLNSTEPGDTLIVSSQEESQILYEILLSRYRTGGGKSPTSCTRL